MGGLDPDDDAWVPNPYQREAEEHYRSGLFFPHGMVEQQQNFFPQAWAHPEGNDQTWGNLQGNDQDVPMANRCHFGSRDVTTPTAVGVSLRVKSKSYARSLPIARRSRVARGAHLSLWSLPRDVGFFL